MPERNRQVLLKRRPEGMPTPADFDIVDAPLPEPKEGEVLLRGIYLSLDPYMRGRISGMRSYAKPTEIGDVIEGRVVGQVVRSNHPDFREGDYAMGGYGWQLYSAVPGSGLLKLDPSEAPISTALGILGMPGMTAYIGLSDIGQPKSGETVVVSAASGAVGAVAGQLAKRQGARIVGIAGGADKCRYVKDELGFDAALDHHGPDLGAALDEACPKGIDVYFENVGGAVQQAVFPRLNDFGRMVMCGMISEYNDQTPRPGPNLGAVVRKRLKIQGFIVSDQRHRQAEFRAMAASLVKKRPAQIPRGHRRRPRPRAGSVYRPPPGQEFRQIARPPRRRPEPLMADFCEAQHVQYSRRHRKCNDTWHDNPEAAGESRFHCQSVGNQAW
jgi:NADPH-dependent curcumin reductase CurA